QRATLGVEKKRPDRVVVECRTKPISIGFVRGDDRRYDTLHRVIQWIVTKANEVLVEVAILDGRETWTPHVFARRVGHFEPVQRITSAQKGALNALDPIWRIPRTVGHPFTGPIRTIQSESMNLHSDATAQER